MYNYLRSLNNYIWMLVQGLKYGYIAKDLNQLKLFVQMLKYIKIFENFRFQTEILQP